MSRIVSLSGAINNVQNQGSQAVSRFDITPNGQQVHIAFGPPNEESSRHPCFRVESQEALLKLQSRVYEHFEAGGKGAPRAADKPGQENSGSTKLYSSLDLIY